MSKSLADEVRRVLVEGSAYTSPDILELVYEGPTVFSTVDVLDGLLSASPLYDVEQLLDGLAELQIVRPEIEKLVDKLRDVCHSAPELEELIAAFAAVAEHGAGRRN